MSKKAKKYAFRRFRSSQRNSPNAETASPPKGTRKPAVIERRRALFASEKARLFERRYGFGISASRRKIQDNMQSRQIRANVASVKEILQRLVKPEAVDSWFNKKVPSLNERTPLQMIRQGKTHLVLEALVRVEEGLHS